MQLGVGNGLLDLGRVVVNGLARAAGPFRLRGDFAVLAAQSGRRHCRCGSEADTLGHGSVSGRGLVARSSLSLSRSPFFCQPP